LVERPSDPREGEGSSKVFIKEASLQERKRLLECLKRAENLIELKMMFRKRSVAQERRSRGVVRKKGAPQFANKKGGVGLSGTYGHYTGKRQRGI